jgi:ABC-type amino acid transport substrate-binding protein
MTDKKLSVDKADLDRLITVMSKRIDAFDLDHAKFNYDARDRKDDMEILNLLHSLNQEVYFAVIVKKDETDDIG